MRSSSRPEFGTTRVAATLLLSIALGVAVGTVVARVVFSPTETESR